MDLHASMHRYVYGARLYTWEVPWLGLVEVDLSNGDGVEVAVEHLGREVVGDDLAVGGVEPEPRRKLQAAVHPLLLLLLLVVDVSHGPYMIKSTNKLSS